MNRWRKIWTIATFEFLTAVKRPGYLITTFGMPVFMAAYAGVVAIPAYFARQADNASSIYGVVDQAQLLKLPGDVASERPEIPPNLQKAIEASGQSAALEQGLANARFVFRPFGSEGDARTALAARSVKGYFVVPSDYLERGVIDVYTPDEFNMSGGDSRSAFATIVRERLLAGRVERPLSDRLVNPLKDTRQFSITRTGALSEESDAAGFVRLGVPVIFMILFLMSILMTSGYLMQGTATEKENKVVEVLLASANPDEILAGKLVGLGGAGLLQIVVWLSILLAGGLGVVPMLLASRVEMPWMALAMAIPLFLAAFLFFGSLMLGTGSLGSNMREAQQLAMIWSLTAALPMMMMSVLISEPHGAVARVLTLIPFSAAPVIIFRASIDLASLAWWEVALAFVILSASTWVALRVGARLFRIGLLSASRPKLREVFRQARLSA
jgi:ABC-2 type transport system permease protein